MAKRNENKTAITEVSPQRFIDSLDEGQRKDDAMTLLSWFGDVTGMSAAMWGGSIIGFGSYHYRYDSGREGDYLMSGFSPRKAATSIYILPGYQFGTMPERLQQLGKHRSGKSCLYVNKLEDIDLDVLAGIVGEGLDYLREHYETVET